MEKGPKNRKLIKQYLLNRQKVPDELADIPELMPGLDMYLSDYLFLAKYAGGECIRLSEVFLYADQVGMGDEYLDDFLEFIPELDQVRMKYLAKRAKDET